MLLDLSTQELRRRPPATLPGRFPALHALVLVAIGGRRENTIIDERDQLAGQLCSLNIPSHCGWSCCRTACSIVRSITFGMVRVPPAGLQDLYPELSACGW